MEGDKMAGKKKRKRGPLIMGGLLAVCLALYGGLLYYNKTQEQEETAETETEKLYKLEEGQIRKISLKYEGETVLFTRNDEENWQLEGDASFPLRQSYLTEMAGCLSALSPVRELDGAGVDAAGEYGLDSPELTVVFTDQEGAEHSVSFGNINSSTGDRYGMTDSGKIYTFSDQDAAKFRCHLNDLATVEEWPAVSRDDVESIVVENGGDVWILEQRPAGDLRLDPTDTLTWFARQPDGSQMAVDSTAAESIVSAVTGLSAERCVEVRGRELMEQYGLGDGAATVTVAYTVTRETEPDAETEETKEKESEKQEEQQSEPEMITEHRTMKLRIGGQAEDGVYYVNMDGSERIYTIAQSVAEQFLKLDREKLGSLKQAQIAKTSVEAITVEGRGILREYRIEQREEPVEGTDGVSGTDGKMSEAEAAITFHYYQDDTEIEETAFTELYQLLTGFAAQRFLTEEEIEATMAEGKLTSPELTLTYHRKNGLPDVTVAFAPYDADFYVMQVDDSEPLFVNKMNLSKIWEQLVQ